MFTGSRTFKRHVMRPFALEINAGDFAFAAGHRRIAIGLLSGTLRCKPTPVAAAAFRSANRRTKPWPMPGDIISGSSR
jgi:hypothetical protein